MKRILIKNGTLISDTASQEGDLLIAGEKIEHIGIDLSASDAQIIDATGKLILPGGVDPHTHFDLPMFGTVSSDDHYTGHKAAAFGGTTTVIDFVPQDLPSITANLDAWHAKADHKAAIDFGFHMNITHFNSEVAAQIPSLISDGVTTLKVFTAYNQRLRLEDGDIFQVLRIARQFGFLTMLHAENGDVIDILVQEALAAGHTQPIWHARTRPAWGAVDAVLRAAALSAQAGGAPLYIVHMNASGEADMLAYARQHGLPVMGETCPQYLFFSADDLERPDGSKWICSPPIRTPADQKRLWQAMAENSIQVVGTDHCPFFFNGTQPIEYEGFPIAIPGKELGAGDFSKVPNGLPAVGDRLPILWTYGVGKGRLTRHQFVALTSTNPAKIFGLYPRKGALLPGSDADIVIWDPERRLTYGVAVAQHRTDYNLYEGWELVGFPEKVFLRGTLLVDNGQWFGHAGLGRFLQRSPFAPIL